MNYYGGLESIMTDMKNDELQHHGVLGMHWYERKDGYTHGYIPKDLKAVKEGGKATANAIGKVGKATVNATIKFYKDRQAKKEAKRQELFNGNPHGRPKNLYKKAPRKLSDDELRAITNRMTIEDNFRKALNNAAGNKNNDKDKSAVKMKLIDEVMNYPHLRSYRKAYNKIHKLSDAEIVSLTNRLKAENSYYKTRGDLSTGYKRSAMENKVIDSAADYLVDMTTGNEVDKQDYVNALNKGKISKVASSIAAAQMKNMNNAVKEAAKDAKKYNSYRAKYAAQEEANRRKAEEERKAAEKDTAYSKGKASEYFDISGKPRPKKKKEE